MLHPINRLLWRMNGLMRDWTAESICLATPQANRYNTSRWITASCTVSGLWRFSSSWSSAVRVSIIVLYLSLLFDDVLFCLPFCWCPCMVIHVSVQYDGGFLPDIILLTQFYYHRGTRLNAMKRFCIFSYWSHLNVLTFFPPDWGMLRRSRCIQIFLLKKKNTSYSTGPLTRNGILGGLRLKTLLISRATAWWVRCMP